MSAFARPGVTRLDDSVIEGGDAEIADPPRAFAAAGINLIELGRDPPGLATIARMESAVELLDRRVVARQS